MQQLSPDRRLAVALAAVLLAAPAALAIPPVGDAARTPTLPARATSGSTTSA